MRKAKLYLAGMALGIFLTAGNMPLVAKAANISPNSRGTIITDNDVPGDNGEIPPDYVRVQNPGTEEYVVIPEEDVPQAFVKVQDPKTQEYVYILEEDVPLASIGLPATGDSSHTVLWLILFMTSLGGMIYLLPGLKSGR